MANCINKGPANTVYPCLIVVAGQTTIIVGFSHLQSSQWQMF